MPGLHKEIYHSAQWRRLRLRILVANPFCAVCGRPASEVDHKQAIEDGGDPWDEGNLQPLCPRCHSAKTWREVMARHGKTYRPRGCDEAGEPVAGWMC